MLCSYLVELGAVPARLVELLELLQCSFLGALLPMAESLNKGCTDVSLQLARLAAEIEVSVLSDEVLIESVLSLDHSVLDIDLLLLVATKGRSELGKDALLVIGFQLVSKDIVLSLVSATVEQPHWPTGLTLTLEVRSLLHKGSERSQTGTQTSHHVRLHQRRREREGSRRHAARNSEDGAGREIVGRDSVDIVGRQTASSLSARSFPVENDDGKLDFVVDQPLR